MGNSIKTKNVFITEEIDYNYLGSELRYRPILKNIYLKLKTIDNELEVFTFSNRKIFHCFKIEKNKYRIEGFMETSDSYGYIFWDQKNFTMNLKTDISPKPSISIKGHIHETNKDNGTRFEEYDFIIQKENNNKLNPILETNIEYLARKPINKYKIKILNDYILIYSSQKIISVGRVSNKQNFNNEIIEKPIEFYHIYSDNNGLFYHDKVKAILTYYGLTKPILSSEYGDLKLII